MRSIVRLLSLVLATAAASAGQASQPEVSDGLEGPWPPVAAQFRHEVIKAGQVVTSENWRRWRDGERIVSERPDAQTGEIWQRDGKALIVTRLFHAHQRGIEYQPGDVSVMGAESGWDRQALGIDPAVLRQLSMLHPENEGGVPLQRYRGTVAGASWDVTLRRDLMLPTQVTVEREDRLERVTLTNAEPLAEAAWQPTPSRSYELIDFADLGDRERDPFVLEIQAAGSDAYGHSHQ